MNFECLYSKVDDAIGCMYEQGFPEMVPVFSWLKKIPEPSNMMII